MKRITLLVIVALMAGFMFVGAKAALAVDLPCDLTPGNECQITTSHTLAAGTYTTPVGSPVLRIIGPSGELKVLAGGTLTLNIAGALPTGLIIELGGKITGDVTGTSGVGSTLNINVASGDVLLATSGATISAQNTAGGGCGSGHGGVINLAANGLNAKITTEDGTTISVNGDTCSAGAINISAPNKGSIDIDGDVLSQSLKSGSGTHNSTATPPVGGTQQPGGGPIFITAACDLTISDTGVVSSKGRDPGADLVHLQGGCDVLINGLVESTGTGHAIPGNPPNSCDDVIPHAGSVRRNPATRPGKPSNSTACVEVWAGNSLIINKDSLNNGEINADTGASPGGSEGTSWIDLFVRGDIKILNSTSDWAVHANGNAGTDNGGVVTVKSAGTGPAASPGKIFLTGLALQASAAAHGQGGTVDVEGMFDVDLRAIGINPDGKIQAKGGNGAPSDHGGHIIILSQADIRAGSASNLNVNGHPNTAAQDGTVVLRACGTIDFPPSGGPGTISAGAIVTNVPGVCPATVTFPTLLPFCPCDDICQE
jgi:hypothetical protein